MTGFHRAGYLENFKLRVPAESATPDKALRGSLFPERRQKISTQWSGVSSGEISVLTGGLWDHSVSELLVQPLMYGKFMEYAQNGKFLTVAHTALHVLQERCHLHG